MSLHDPVPAGFGRRVTTLVGDGKTHWETRETWIVISRLHLAATVRPLALELSLCTRGDRDISSVRLLSRQTRMDTPSSTHWQVALTSTEACTRPVLLLQYLPRRIHHPGISTHQLRVALVDTENASSCACGTSLTVKRAGASNVICMSPLPGPPSGSWAHNLGPNAGTAVTAATLDVRDSCVPNVSCVVSCGLLIRL